MTDLARMPDLVLNGDAAAAAALAREAVASGVDPEEIIKGYLIPAMDEVGRRFACGEAFIPELLVAAQAMKGALAVIDPLLRASGVKPAGRVAIGTVRGDVHDIGKNLVASMLVGGGFEVHDLGTNVGAEQFVEAARDHEVDIVALSALLTTTMPAMREVIGALDRAGIRSRVKVMVGGAPLTQAYADQIGADGFSPNAKGAVDEARRLVSG